VKQKYKIVSFIIGYDTLERKGMQLIFEVGVTMDKIQQVNKKRHTILAAAVRLFKQYHPNKVNIRDIATEANVSVVTIYNHFQSKEGLILEVVKLVVSQQIERLKNIATGNISFEEKIEAIIFKQTQLITEFHPDFLKLMENSNIVDYLNNNYKDQLLKLFLGVIKQGRKENCINLNVPDSFIINLFDLFNRDIQSGNSLLLANCSIDDLHNKIIEIIIYGLSGKR
jgi:AcrR family transcriptional regulator